MKYYLYVSNNDLRIPCGNEILNLNNGDMVFKDGIMYEVTGKFIDYEEQLVDVNVVIEDLIP